MDVMTSEVITVDENASVQAAAKLLVEHGISAVVDKDNRVIGMVSEGDLLHRAETGTERRRSWWLEMGTATDQQAAEYIKSHSGKGGGRHDARCHLGHRTDRSCDIAVMLETHRIKWVPVLRDGKLIGIVSRANLVRALAMTVNEPPSGIEADDRAIRDKLLAELKAQKWTEVSSGNITVKDGVVHLWSSYLSDYERRALVLLAENTPGVRRGVICGQYLPTCRARVCGILTGSRPTQKKAEGM